MNAVLESDLHLLVPCTDDKFWETGSTSLKPWHGRSYGCSASLDVEWLWTRPSQPSFDNVGHIGDGGGMQMKGLMSDSLVLRAEKEEEVINLVKKILH